MSVVSRPVSVSPFLGVISSSMTLFVFHVHRAKFVHLLVPDMVPTTPENNARKQRHYISDDGDKGPSSEIRTA